jgi:hypothetical protein
MKRDFFLISVIVAITLSPSAWYLKKDSEGIKVFVGEAHGSKFKQFKVETYIDGDPQKISELIADVENNYKWLKDVKKAQIIKRKSNSEFTFQQVFKMPFPFSDRLMVLLCTINKLPNGGFRIDMVDNNEECKSDDQGLVVIPVSIGYWKLEPKNGKTYLEYSFMVDPGGYIPAWLVNMFLIDNPFETTKNLKALMASNG